MRIHKLMAASQRVRPKPSWFSASTPAAQRWRLMVAAIGLLVVPGCGPRRGDPTPVLAVTADDPDVGRDVTALFGALQTERLRALSAAADAAPGDAKARRASGMAHMWAALGGALALSRRAEEDLEAAFALTPDDAGLTRALGRFYNMRAVAGDRSKVGLQVQVYAAYLAGTTLATMTPSQFVGWSFSRLGAILDLRNHGRLLAALAQIEALEDTLAQRVAAHPDDIELHALVGNFAFFFSGNVPMGRAARVRTAVAHFEIVRDRWDEMRAGARDSAHCPNTYENFMFELAEGYLALGRRDDAARMHRALTTVRPPETRAKQQIAQISAERLANADRYDGNMDLMPPWPSDVANCVVCHARHREVSLDSLYTARR